MQVFRRYHLMLPLFDEGTLVKNINEIEIFKGIGEHLDALSTTNSTPLIKMDKTQRHLSKVFGRRERELFLFQVAWREGLCLVVQVPLPTPRWVSLAEQLHESDASKTDQKNFYMAHGAPYMLRQLVVSVSCQTLSDMSESKKKKWKLIDNSRNIEGPSVVAARI
ncbi:hypothetical protein Nepgr_030624 [Nepenthes gracilis]|uniref:Uncharacterized protein n=1 Tax=Nepenthes gracilis TaxID=150966 RepID=A0AAD3TGK8_NEPGR|nr:hypothetical protein Nepgr_030624 [Nepenthes gracilis]